MVLPQPTIMPIAGTPKRRLENSRMTKAKERKPTELLGVTFHHHKSFGPAPFGKGKEKTNSCSPGGQEHTRVCREHTVIAGGTEGCGETPATGSMNELQGANMRLQGAQMGGSEKTWAVGRKHGAARTTDRL